MTTLIRNVKLLDEYGFGTKSVAVIVENGKYSYIGEAEPRIKVDEVIDGKGNLLIPAFYNTHCHAAMTLFRGYGEDLPLDRWLNEKIFPAEDKLTPKSVNIATKLAIAEMLANGVASFSDMYMFMDEVANAVLETGIKANLSRSIVSFAESDNIQNDSRFLESVKLVKDFDGAANGKLKVDMSLHAEYTNTEQMARFIAEYTRENNLGMQVHISETEKEHHECIERRSGRTPIEFFNDCGLLDARTTAAHCVYVTENDMNIIKEKNVSVAHNSVSNLKLGSGVMQLRKMLDKGINVTLGTDGVASNNNLDVLKELQYAVLLGKGISRQPECVTAREMLPLATRNGAIAQGRADCGEIKIGYKADAVLVDLDSVNNIPSYDYYTTLAYSAKSSDVLMTMVDGEILYKNGEYKTIDIEKLKFEAKDVINHYFD